MKEQKGNLAICEAGGSKKCRLLGKTAWLTSKSLGKPNDTANRIMRFSISQGGMLFRGANTGRTITRRFGKNRRVNGAAAGSGVKSPQSHGSSHGIGKTASGSCLKILANRLTFHPIFKGITAPFYQEATMKHQSMVRQVQDTFP